MPVKKCSFVCYSPVGLVNASPIGHQSQTIWVSVPRAAAAEAGAQMSVPAPSWEILVIWSRLEGVGGGGIQWISWSLGRMAVSL